MNQHHPPDVIGIGMCTVDLLFVVPQLPAFGKRIRATHYLRQSGGPVATALVTLARLGVSTRFIGKVGDDPEGTFIREEFQREGVDISGLIVEPNAYSRVVLVLVNETTGERCFTPRQETYAHLTAADLNRAGITSAKILHLDDADEPSIQAAKWAKAAGVCVVYDGSWYNESVMELLPFVDVPILGEAFAQRWMPGVPLTMLFNGFATSGRALRWLRSGSAAALPNGSAGYSRFQPFQSMWWTPPARGMPFTGDSSTACCTIGVLRRQSALLQRLPPSTAVRSVDEAVYRR